MLRAVADEFSCLSEVMQDIVTGNGDLTFRGDDVSRQTLKGR